MRTPAFDWKRFSPEQIQAARETVAGDWAENARAIRQEDPYASHVTEAEKDMMLDRGLIYAEGIRAGQHDACFTIAQRLWEVLTGDCIALLP
jgi:hypothetical protein